jgi:beta-lactam-binding protein with PASTA domain
MPEFSSGMKIENRYRLDSRLDPGGVAQVWRALDEDLDRNVAVKLLVTEGVDEAAVEAFRQEAQAEASLDHPSIVEVFDWGHTDGAVFVVMELLDGLTVRQHLAQGTPYEWPVVLGAGRQLASALVTAHADGIAHGNIGPERVIVSGDGQATLTGFGVWCRGQCETPPAPDTDTFALGALLYEMLTGVSPLAPRPAETPASAAWPPALHEHAKGIPARFDRVVMKAVSPDPAHRYETAAELLADLDAAARPKTHWGAFAALAVVAVLAAVGITYAATVLRTVVVPDVTGKSPTDATAALSTAGLKAVDAGQQASTAVGTGTVAAENPAAGTTVRRGAQVGIVVSSGVPQVDVPSVAGVDLRTASARLSALGLVVGQVQRANSTTYPVDVVISAFPSAGTSVSIHTPVDLVVSAGQATVTMPDVRGASQANATSKLSALGLVVDVGRQYSSQPVGTVVSQGPQGGATVPAGGTVVISVSQGPAPIKIPDLAGSSPSVARTTLENLGLIPITSVEASGTTPSKKGIVIGTEPEAGESVKPGAQVTINVGN